MNVYKYKYNKYTDLIKIFQSGGKNCDRPGILTVSNEDCWIDTTIYGLLGNDYLSCFLMMEWGVILNDKFKSSINLPSKDFKFLSAFLLEKGRTPFSILEKLIEMAAHTDAYKLKDALANFHKGLSFTNKFTLHFLYTEEAVNTYLPSNDGALVNIEVPFLQRSTSKQEMFINIPKYFVRCFFHSRNKISSFKICPDYFRQF